MTESKKNSKIDDYLSKNDRWKTEMEKLRSILLDLPLTEELKWGKPCYMYQKDNVVILIGFKEYCCIGFFKGSLLKDTKGILVRPSESSQSYQIRFTNVEEIDDQEESIKKYVQEAIEIEKAGLKVEVKPKAELQIPEELQKKLDEIPEFKAAFEALTPGRQNGYIYHFSQPKQSSTRESRIEKYRSKIMEGKGMNDK